MMMNLFKIAECQYLIYLKRKYSWREFQETAKITPDTYSETFSKKIYCAVFENSIKPIEEYRKYYQKEYKSIDQFMFWRHGISEEILCQIIGKPQGFIAIFKFDYWIEDEIVRNAIEQLLVELETK